MSNQPVPYPIRMPDELRTRLVERTRTSGRSLHAEIIGILQEAVGNGPGTGPAIDLDALARALAPKLAEELGKHQMGQRNEAT
jgi:plasmid stability protein